MKGRLFVQQEYNTLAYYYGESEERRVLLARVPSGTISDGGHWIAVITRLRQIEGADPGYQAARAIWEERTVWYNTTEGPH